MKNITLQQFFAYYDQMADAETRKDFRTMQKMLKKMEQLPVINDFQWWLLEHAKAIFQLLYNPKCDIPGVSQKLLELRCEARNSPDDLFQLVQRPYFLMLVHLLQKNYNCMEQLPEYEEIALELLEFLKNRDMEEKIQKDLCEDIQFKDVYVFAHGVLGKYYSQKGRVVLGEHYYQKVWEMVWKDEYISGYVFCTLNGLAANKGMQGDFTQGCEICAFLWQRLLQKKVTKLHPIDVQHLVLIYIGILQNCAHNSMAWDILNQALDLKLVYPTGEKEYLSDIYGNYIAEAVRHSYAYSKDRLREIERYLKKYEQKQDFHTLVPWQRSNYYLEVYYLELLKNEKVNSGNLDKAAKILLEEEFAEADRMPFLQGMMHVLGEYEKYGDVKKLKVYTERFMQKLLEYYSTAEYFIENEKMEQYLGICRLGFEYAFLAVAEVEIPEKLMEYSLNYKNLLSSAIRLRNRVSPEELIVRDKNVSEFPYYSFRQLVDKLPESTAIVDFLYMNPRVYAKKAIDLRSAEERNTIHCFVLAKKRGKIFFRYRKIEDDRDIKADILQFLERVKNAKGKLNNLAKRLYIELFQTFEDVLEDVEHLWISPDQDICNLPLQILLTYSEKPWACQDMVYWQSLRDIFETWQAGGQQTTVGCTIGNPEFSLQEIQAAEDSNPAKRFIREQIIPLPFSGYEAEKIARILNCPCCIGEKATKYAITSGYRYLHVATHGIIQQKNQNPWYNSALAFAGIVDYMDSGKKSKEYGDGLLTAEEISRMNLSGTELVVLSACNSGSSRFSGLRQQTGLHVAFGVAGVKYIISALWEVDDLAAAMFMFQFYENLLVGQPVPVAVETARKQLRCMTVEKLKSIVEKDSRRMDDKLEDLVKNLVGLPENYTLYASPQYWGSFICYECMR